MNSHILNVWLTRRYKNVSCFPLVNEVEGRQRRFASFRFYEDKGVNVSKKNTEGHSKELNDILSLDDMLEKIVRIRQGNLPVKDFIRTFRQEYKTYKEHGGSFLDREAALEIVEKRLTEAEEDSPFANDKEKEQERERESLRLGRKKYKRSQYSKERIRNALATFKSN